MNIRINASATSATPLTSKQVAAIMAIIHKSVPKVGDDPFKLRASTDSVFDKDGGPKGKQVELVVDVLGGSASTMTLKQTQSNLRKSLGLRESPEIVMHFYKGKATVSFIIGKERAVSAVA